MIVAGGVYWERCVEPSWHNLLGSGGRAAGVLASAVSELHLVSYIDAESERHLAALSQSFGFKLDTNRRPVPISFEYVHGLSVPVIRPAPEAIPALQPLECRDSVILRFGMLEGSAVVHGQSVVYDPQSPARPVPFRANGSSATQLAVVANAAEARQLSGGLEPLDAGRAIRDAESAEVVVIKQGPNGCLVFDASGVTTVSAYRSARVWALGSGDVFAAAFTHFWGEQRLPAPDAADLSSRAVADYCESRSLSLRGREELLRETRTTVGLRRGRVYLAAPFFSLGQRWLVEEARDHLLRMGLEVFSPLHDVGRGSAQDVVEPDLAGLETCDRLLALVDGADPGTMFEVGYARARKIAVVALSQSLDQQSRKMIDGSGCVITDDFVTGIYLTVWGA